jgi:hypothetical protein
VRKNMLYKPKYCSECGSELQDFGESFLLRSRFCDTCKPNFKKTELVSRFGGAVFATIAIVFGVGAILKNPIEKPLNITKSEIATIATAPKSTQKAENNQQNTIAQPKQVEANRQVALSSKQVETQLQKQASTVALDKKTQQNLPEVSQISVPEAVYMCGAKTKKGLPCSRKVKGTVRCWQHVGQEAMLLQKDLKIQ